ncbi:FecCD family ABC transporter permease [Dermabacteraceae bacterium P13147]
MTPAETPRPVRRAGALKLSIVLAALLSLLPLALLSVAVGSRTIAPAETWAALTAYDPTNDAHLVIRELRIPRTMIGILAGAALGLAGCLMQSLTRNTLAEPGTLGVNAGAAAGVVIGLLILGDASITIYVWFAFCGAGLAAFAVHRLGRAGERGVNPVRLVLAGAGLSVLLGSLTSMVLVSFPETVYESFRSWATGSLQGRGWDVVPVAAVCLLCGALIAVFLAGSLNAVALGSDMSAALGVHVSRTWSLTNLAVLVLAGGATAAVGPIAFVGLAAPHVARALVGVDHRWTLPTSALFAAIALLAADILGRVVDHPNEIGAGVMTAFLGAPFFVFLVRRGKLRDL